MTNPAYSLDIDALSMTRNMPYDLVQAIPTLMVNRFGGTEESYMRTENFIGHTESGKVYQLSLNGFSERPGWKSKTLPEATTPPYCILQGEWDEKIDMTIEESNILGGNGRYILPKGNDSLVIPVAETTPENLSFYDCHLIALGEVTRFDAMGNLPVTLISIGGDYPRDYLLDPAKGGGVYLEVHDQPHFHMPMNEDASGYLIIGQRDTDKGHCVSAFKIPYGYGVNMAPWAIHCDAYLVGRYMVIYSTTLEFSTVIIRKQDGSLAPILFEG